MENTSGLRKGAWTYEEDKLLKDCINKYGEGKWHLISQRAGLNRCRKSCRLRWLNYLNPTINRQSFSEDEVDMILRLHKLLGNRWSLIAGRLPGRTSNDVKNYWHTHVMKKVVSKKDEKEREKPKETMKVYEVIKPQPRTFSTHSVSNKVGKVPNDLDELETRVPNYDIGKDCASSSQPSVGNASIQSAMWTDSLRNLEEQVGSEKFGPCSSLHEDINFNMEFPNADDFFWNSNLGDFNSLLDL